MATQYLTRDGDMLDDLCWRHYGRQSGVVEAVLDANPGLSEQGPVYPAGLTLTLPELAPIASPTTPARLWD